MTCGSTNFLKLARARLDRMPSKSPQPDQDGFADEQEKDEAEDRPLPEEPSLEPSDPTSDEDIRRDTFGPSRRKTLREEYS